MLTRDTGSSAINGLYLNRPAEMELDTWQGLLGNMEGKENWSWKSFFAAMKKSETFTPAADNIASEGDITWDPTSHGTNGPIHMSYPGWYVAHLIFPRHSTDNNFYRTFPIVGQWATAVETVGIADSGDTYGGANWGAYVATSAINPANWTRSYSKTGYLDPLPHRPNYDVLANAQVTRILFDSGSKAGNLTANAVEYTPDNGATKLTVKVRKEVILAGGSVGSPTVLQYSGVGPKDVLEAAGVAVISELPGVGQHLQDHATTSTTWSTDQPTAGSLYADDPADASNPAFLSYVNSAVAYVNATTLFGDGVAGLQSTVLSYMNDYAPEGIYEDTVMAGYKTIYQTTANKYLNSPLGVAELVLGDDMDGAIRVGPSLQHPFSQGRIWITTNNPMDYPQIDPAYFKNPVGKSSFMTFIPEFELTMYLQTFKFNVRHSNSPVVLLARAPFPAASQRRPGQDLTSNPIRTGRTGCAARSPPNTTRPRPAPCCRKSSAVSSTPNSASMASPTFVSQTPACHPWLSPVI